MIKQDFICLLFLFISLAVRLSAQGMKQDEPTVVLTESAKIEYLIKSVNDLKDAEFFRNGSYYDSHQAAAHLQMKLDRAGNRIRTANDFIDYIASRSSVTGVPYRIRFSDGKEIKTQVFLRQKLKELESDQ